MSGKWWQCGISPPLGRSCSPRIRPWGRDLRRGGAPSRWAWARQPHQLPDMSQNLQAIEAYRFHTDVQFALNVEPGVQICTRTLERYQQLFRDDDLAALTFKNVTEALVEKLEQDVSLQRLDSTHLYSHMATFGRTKLMAVAIKRFLVQVKRHDPQVYAALPEPLRLRYELAQSQLFGNATDAEARRS
jgi:hypothetical protein